MNGNGNRSTGRKGVAKAIYKKIFYASDVSYDDTDYLLILAEIERIPEDRAFDFYRSLISEAGRMELRSITLPMFFRHIEEFRERLESEIWEEFRIEERGRSLLVKIGAVLERIGAETMKGESLDQILRKVESDIDEVKIESGGKKQKLFDRYEKEVLVRLGGFRDFSRKVLSPSYSKRVLLDEIERVFRSVMVDFRVLGLDEKRALEKRDGVRRVSLGGGRKEKIGALVSEMATEKKF